ncbi:MAG: hypothetical protein EBS48_05620, partial [Actinobacteria bacterium]|nr:hypothetical protein [Actinomycetota bacterium]
MEDNGSARGTGDDTSLNKPVDNSDRERTSGDGGSAEGGSSAAKKRRRGSRGGKNRKKPAGQGGESTGSSEDRSDGQSRNGSSPGSGRNPQELPDPPREGRVSDPDAAEKSLVRKPQIGDTRPAPAKPAAAAPKNDSSGSGNGKRKRRGGRGRSR